MELGSDVQRAVSVYAEQKLVCLANKAHHGADLRCALVPQLVVRTADFYLQALAALVLENHQQEHHQAFITHNNFIFTSRPLLFQDYIYFVFFSFKFNNISFMSFCY